MTADQKLRAAAEDERRRVAKGDQQVRTFLGIPDDEPHLLAEALSNGVDSEMVKATRAYEHLGPRSGISDVRRLFRGINLGIISWE